jgi:hypothetical protein
MEVLQISEKGYVVASSCFLVSARPPFYPVFGRFWTHVGPKFGWRFFSYVLRRKTAPHLPTRPAVSALHVWHVVVDQ